MIVGIGTDICSLSRIEEVLGRQSKFFAKVLNPSEQRLYLDRPEHDRVRYMASRFAAKEAALKALGTGLAQGIKWHDLDISNLESGQPSLTFSGRAKEIADLKGITRMHISLSDEQAYAIAYVILES